MRRTKHLVVGLGEVGSALKTVLKAKGIEAGDPLPKCEFLHICFPYSKDFVKYVKAYQRRSDALYTIIHSTVPIGTSRKCHASHSPVRGVHPHMVEGLKTFRKFLGVYDDEGDAIEREFRKYFMVMVADKPEDTEAMKLWDTTQYGIMILLEKEITRFCEKHGLDRSVVYEYANVTYNNGYQHLERSEVVRPYLKHYEGKIGGHCVIPNAKLLNSPSGWLLRFVNWLL